MKRIIFIVAFIVSLSSCSTYYYSILDTPNTNTERIENGDFLFENDSLWIAYNFGGENAPVNITVFNKLNTPLYIDWKQSALIINDVAESYANSNIPFYGEAISQTVKENRHQSVTYKEFGGVLEGSKDISYVFPQTMVSNKFMNIYVDYKNIVNSDYQNVSLRNKVNKKMSVKKANYNIDNSPLKFKSYLTLYYDATKPMYFQSEFYVAEIIKSSTISPNNLPLRMNDKGNIFYYEKTNDTGWYILGGAAVVGVAVLSTTMDISTTIDDTDF